MLTIKPGTLAELKASRDPVALFVSEGPALSGCGFLPAGLRKSIDSRAKADGFLGKAGTVADFRLHESPGAVRRFFLAGLGKRRSSGDEALRRSAAALLKAAEGKCGRLWVACPAAPDAEAVVEGMMLAGYHFTRYRTAGEPPRLKEIRLLARTAAERPRLRRSIDRSSLSVEAVCHARDLVNRGPSDKAPMRLAAEAKSLAGGGVTLSVIDAKQAGKEGMGLLLAVGRGAIEPPCLLHLVYRPKGRVSKRIGLIGKGVTFDSGGLSLKPPASMDTMKSDMAGAAAVLGVFKVIARLRPRAEVHGFAPLAYNMPGPGALKPGDVVKALSGKSVEILNTDAEGRLILADALAYAARRKLDFLVDIATLTGAVVIALGDDVTGAMTNDRRLLSRLQAAAKRAGEPLWELPLFPAYKDHLKSKIADIKNTGKPKTAGTIAGGLFLEAFVEGKPWVHLDIAGTSWTDTGHAYCPPGGTGAPVRTLLEFIRKV